MNEKEMKTDGLKEKLDGLRGVYHHLCGLDLRIDTMYFHPMDIELVIRKLAQFEEGSYMQRMLRHQSVARVGDFVGTLWGTNIYSCDVVPRLSFSRVFSSP